MTATDPCPCGSRTALTRCCLPYIDGRIHAPTAETLMRSRYTAYTLNRFDYVRASWRAEDCPAVLEPLEGQRWLGLNIKRLERGTATDATGIVEFVARYKIDGRAFRLHEISYFERVDGRWIYCGAVAAS